jgi:hypothetical protein
MCICNPEYERIEIIFDLRPPMVPFGDFGGKGSTVNIKQDYKYYTLFHFYLGILSAWPSSSHYCSLGGL